MNHAAAAFPLFKFELEAVAGANARRHRFLDGLVHVGEHPGAHEVRDDLERLLIQLLRQVAHHDGGLHGDDLGTRWQ